MKKQMAQAKVRLPQELLTWLKIQAAASRRTQNAEIVFRLEWAKKQQEAA